jgi:hypothetical protein
LDQQRNAAASHHAPSLTSSDYAQASVCLSACLPATHPACLLACLSPIRPACLLACRPPGLSHDHTPQVLQLAMHLRRAGYFVLAALTLPFDFEGRRKVEEAAALVEALQDVTNLVVGVAREAV